MVTLTDRSVPSGPADPAKPAPSTARNGCPQIGPPPFPTPLTDRDDVHRGAPRVGGGVSGDGARTGATSGRAVSGRAVSDGGVSDGGTPARGASAEDTAGTDSAREAWQVAAAVLDPELPVLTIADLGVLRDVRVDHTGRVEVVITPTYSGCPAMDAIRADIRAALVGRGFADVTVTTVLSPPWTTDWISEAGRTALREYGIAPPARRDGPVLVPLTVRCPRCGSTDTRQVSRFGSTACKSLRACNACLEPFEHVRTL